MAKAPRAGSRRSSALRPLLNGLKLPALALGGIALLPATALAAPPIAGPDSGTARSGPTAGEEIIINAAANDSDPDGDTLLYNGPFPQGGGTGPGPSGTVIVSPTGTIRYTPPTNSAGGVEVFSYSVDDGTSGPVFADVTVNITGSIAPVATDDSATGQSRFDITVNVLANDSDQDDPVLANRDIQVVTQPANGFLDQACLGACGPLVYRSNVGFRGTDTFTYRVADPLGELSNIATATITVLNNAPLAVNDVFVLPAPGAQSFDPRGNDDDADGDPLTIIAVTQPASGTVTFDSGSVTFTPDGSSTSPDSFTYTISDGQGGEATATISVEYAYQLPASAVDDAVSTTIDVATNVNVTLNDINPSQLPLSVSVSPTSQQGGTLAIVLGDIVQYTPPPGFSGTDTFGYTITFGGEGSSSATVTVQVIDNNNPPVAVIANGSNQTFPDTDGLPGEVATFDSSLSSDPDGDAIVCYWTVNGAAQEAGCGSNVQFPLNDGSNTVELYVTDEFGLSSSTVTANVTVVANGAPTAVIAGGDRTVTDTDGTPGESVAFDGSGSTDGVGTIATYEWSVGGQVIGGANGPTPTLQLPDGLSTVSLVAIDNGGLRSAPASVNVTVGGVNPGPVVTIEVGSNNIPDSDGQPGENVPFRGSAIDSNGSVQVSTFRWFVNDEPVPAADGQATPTLLLANGSNTVVLTATDNLGEPGFESIVVTIGETSAIEDLPGVTGNENLENTARATESVCSELLKADPASLSSDQVNLRNSCQTIFDNVEENPEGVVDALQQIGAQQVTTQQTTAIDFTAAQMLNVAGRLTALRQGAKGVSLAGLNVSGAGNVPMSALASLGNTLFGTEGGSSGEDEAGGLLDDRLGIFLNGSVRFGDKDATSRESGFEFDTLGVTAGLDYRFTDALVAGFALGYGNATADFDSNSGSQDSDSYSGSLYGSWYGERSYVDGIASLGSVSYDTVRKINLFNGSIVDRALGSTDGTQWALGVSTGYDFGQGALRFGPNLALNYIKVDIDSFRERTTGTSGLAMAFGDQSADSLTMKAGAHFNYSLSRKWGILSPQARFDLVREFANESQKVTIRYANDPITVGPGGAGSSFVIFTDDPDEYYFLWAVGLAAQFANGLSGFVDYEQTEGLDTISTAEFTFGLRYQTKFR